MWFLGGLLLIAISLICDNFEHYFIGWEYIITVSGHIARDLGIAISSAALIAKIIEVPNFINFINSRTIEALKNYEFLRSLDKDDLEKVKKKCTKIIFEKTGNVLINLKMNR